MRKLHLFLKNRSEFLYFEIYMIIPIFFFFYGKKSILRFVKLNFVVKIKFDRLQLRVS